MKNVFLGCILPDSIYSEIVNNSKGSVQNAADALQKSFIEGFSETLSDFSILNYPCIGMYPTGYRKIWFNGCKASYVTYKKKKVPCDSPQFCNLYMYSRRSIRLSIERKIYSILQTENRICLLVYAITPWTMKACHNLKKSFKKRISIVLIVPDLPEYTGERKYWIQDVLLKKRQRDYCKCYSDFDGFVFLTKFMADKIPVGNKPWTVVEGIFNWKDDKQPISTKNSVRNIFYSGSLDKRYGIWNLIEAFTMIQEPNISLVLCGKGNAESEIREISKIDSRIQYLGQITREEVLSHQKNAYLLMNPRTFEGEFTKYSFPSKTMEYMASGVPTLIYKLLGVPPEYYNYCLWIDELGVDALKDKLVEILRRPETELQQIGLRARTFIFDKKNPYQQSEIIIKNVLNLIE